MSDICYEVVPLGGSNSSVLKACAPLPEILVAFVYATENAKGAYLCFTVGIRQTHASRNVMLGKSPIKIRTVSIFFSFSGRESYINV